MSHWCFDMKRYTFNSGLDHYCCCHHYFFNMKVERFIFLRKIVHKLFKVLKSEGLAVTFLPLFYCNYLKYFVVVRLLLNQVVARSATFVVHMCCHLVVGKSIIIIIGNNMQATIGDRQHNNRWKKSERALGDHTLWSSISLSNYCELNKTLLWRNLFTFIIRRMTAAKWKVWLTRVDIVALS